MPPPTSPHPHPTTTHPPTLHKMPITRKVLPCHVMTSSCLNGTVCAFPRYELHCLLLVQSVRSRHYYEAQFEWMHSLVVANKHKDKTYNTKVPWDIFMVAVTDHYKVANIAVYFKIDLIDLCHFSFLGFNPKYGQCINRLILMSFLTLWF